MLRNVFLKSLWDQRRSLIWWGIGVAALTLITVLFYPSFSDMPEFNDLLGDEDSVMRAFVGDVSDLTSPEGFLNSQLYFLMVPLLLLVFAIARGSGAIAGEEERGTLDLLLSNPLTRSQVLAQKFAAMIVAILALTFVLWLGAVIGVVAVDMEISFMRMAEATLSAALLGVVFGALEPLSRLSPFYYYIDADPLANGLNFAHVVVLMGLTAVLLAVALITFERRDLTI